MKMYNFIRSNDQFCFVENDSQISSNKLLKSIASPVLYTTAWQPPSKQEKETWASFLKNGRIDNPLFNNQIEKSWRRCSVSEVDPAWGICNKFDSIKKLESRCEKLIHLAKPIMDTLCQCIQDMEFVVVLVDSKGHVLRTLGGTAVLNQAEKVRFEPGADWSEESVGTNAIGTALALGHPVQVTGTEHYCEGHHLWTCSTAPIRDHNAEIIGFLDIGGPREYSAPHQLGLIVAAAHAIETRILLEDSYHKLNEVNIYREAILDSVSEGIIVVNSQGIIVGINKVAAKAFRHRPKEIVGRHIDIIIEDYERLQGSFNSTATGSTKEEILLKMPNGQTTYVATANPVFSEAMNSKGFILNFSPVKKTHFHGDPSKGTIVKFRFADIIGESKAIRKSIEVGKRIAPGSSTVLILGESGTGKELFAQAIHAASDCRFGPFVSVNCGAIPRELIQSELFGYEDGSFTGAKRGGFSGKFEMANGGTIFLDEIGEMPLEMQINLLRVLEERAVTPVGGKKAKPINVRIIAATNKRLFEEVSKGRFRDDLYYRLNVITIALPPLRAREGDILLLAKYFFEKTSRKMGKEIKKLDPDVLRKFENHHWPGNVRELVNAVEYALNISPNEDILAEHLPAYLRENHPEKPQPGANRIVSLVALEKGAIEDALRFYEGNITKASITLGIARNTLYDKIRKYRIDLTTKA